ncbi:DMT family transporter [Congregibacter litoralis]|uniref:Putative permease, DMT superfamily n=1 Tax=Congregibacter litoralis KT71 TaxID=314285 RepID=A4AB01_9GAMM|nr:DMT family transporter [Congregibacter litoralis]EAQ96873.1 putative permease, DMT superfamily [Congregibacter litoralis KT71]
MNAAQLLQLIALAAIWGSSFMFMRLAVSQLGPTWLLEIRLLAASLILLIISRALRRPLNIKKHWRHYLTLGALNTTLPFWAFAYAAQTLPASMLAILNSTAPLWGILIGFLWRGKAITPRAVIGLLLGMAGVASLVGLGGLAVQPEALWAVVLTASAAICYGIASSYAEYAEKVETYANAHGSLWAATLLVLPFMPFAPVPEVWAPGAVAAALVLGVLCTGVAYLLYFHLIATVGAPSALTVGYLIPLWGVLWGWLFLDEAVGLHTLLGAGLVLSGTMLVTNFNPARGLRILLKRRQG